MGHTILPAEIYAHWDYVCGWARAYGCDHDDAEDAAQEALIGAWRTCERWQQRGRLGTWLCGIVRHKVQDVRRRQGKDRRDSAGLAREQDLVLMAVDIENEMRTGAPQAVYEWHPRWRWDDRVETQIIEDETGADVRRVLDDLPARWRQALTLRYLEGLPVTEVARQMGMTLSAAEGVLTRAKAAFRRAHGVCAGSGGGGSSVGDQ